MASKEQQVAEFQSLFVKAYQIYMANGSRPLLEVFANLAYGGIPAAAPDTQSEGKIEEEVKDVVAEETPVESAKGAPEETAPEVEVLPAGSSSRAAPGGQSSINFGDESVVNVRSSTRVRQPAGGASSIVFGATDDEASRPSTRVRVAPGGSSNLQLGGPSLERDNTRKKKKPEVAHIEQKALPTPSQMAASERQSHIFEASKTSDSTKGLSPATNESLIAAIRKFPKMKLAFMEFVGDSAGKLVTKQSFKEGLGRMDIEASEEYVDKVFTDFQKDGSLSFSGFVRFLNSISP
mmetsp:Transcript_26535/g.36978  ORF Transcript_26535/g.36978 Transcript_26535/m.36978 type:complete len:293 (-) Transcript_26535:342-1220(-)